VLVGVLQQFQHGPLRRTHRRPHRRARVHDEQHERRRITGANRLPEILRFDGRRTARARRTHRRRRVHTPHRQFQRPSAPSALSRTVPGPRSATRRTRPGPDPGSAIASGATAPAPPPPLTSARSWPGSNGVPSSAASPSGFARGCSFALESSSLRAPRPDSAADSHRVARRHPRRRGGRCRLRYRPPIRRRLRRSRPAFPVVESPIAGITSASFPCPLCRRRRVRRPHQRRRHRRHRTRHLRSRPGVRRLRRHPRRPRRHLAVLCATFVVECSSTTSSRRGVLERLCPESMRSAKRAAVSTSFSSTRSRPSSAASARAVRAVAMSPR